MNDDGERDIHNQQQADCDEAVAEDEADREYMAEQEHHTRLADGAYAEWYAAINRAEDDAEQREWIAAGGVPFD